MKPLQGRVVLITGASRGIGAATAVLMAKAGADVAVNFFSSESEAAKVVAQIEQQGQKAIAVQADVRNAEDVKRLVETTVNQFGRLDVLVSNANINFAYKPFMEMSWDEFSEKLNGEMATAFRLCQAVVPHMEKQGGGKIITIASGLARTPSPNFIAHGSAKAALVTFTKYLAQELGPKNITANVVSPGLVLTDATKHQPKEMHEMMANLTPLHRLAQPEDIAGAVLSLAADWNSFATGVYLPVNGGMDLS
ncbi:SDR family NAD(P)-dependent oxidoreductase [Effusibacillus dendaii]|uniref:3-oxoacyl-ACP reductase n=1 Tax=Effusibacillus dendaii TaxID=2743772 RepID=A0A7I8DBM6_9BACL|nr:3-oxoacyl-ACP reductase family protein [Effusibacillus dendaii]BCJ87578.1 3-oxoacyl-ACP reductase [Effusibacillus dendaii]